MRHRDPHGATTIVAESRSGGLKYLWLTAVVIAIDQVTKWLIEHSLGMYQAIVVLPVLEITRAHNPGAAFSFLAGADGWQRWVFTALAIGVSIALVIWLRRIDSEARILACAVALIL